MYKETKNWGDLDMQHEVAFEAAKASPALGGTVIYYLTLNEWVGVATLLYVIAQLGFLIHKWIWAIHDRRKQK